MTTRRTSNNNEALQSCAVKEISSEAKIVNAQIIDNQKEIKNILAKQDEMYHSLNTNCDLILARLNEAPSSNETPVASTVVHSMNSVLQTQFDIQVRKWIREAVKKPDFAWNYNEGCSTGTNLEATVNIIETIQLKIELDLRMCPNEKRNERELNWSSFDETEIKKRLNRKYYNDKTEHMRPDTQKALRNSKQNRINRKIQKQKSRQKHFVDHPIHLEEMRAKYSAQCMDILGSHHLMSDDEFGGERSDGEEVWTSITPSYRRNQPKIVEFFEEITQLISNVQLNRLNSGNQQGTRKRRRETTTALPPPGEDSFLDDSAKVYLELSGLLQGAEDFSI
ncbi:hypothetical protein MBANPS3_007788 [Mucor bainieri]